jgi:hypothetical protein
MNQNGSVIPNGAAGTNDVSAIRVGDMVGAEGMMAEDADFTIDASFMRDWTTNPLAGAFDASAASDVMSVPAPEPANGMNPVTTPQTGDDTADDVNGGMDADAEDSGTDESDDDGTGSDDTDDSNADDR